jgi:hypothetical protein
MTDALRNFMEVCAYQPEEMGKEMPRLKKVFDRMNLNEEDLVRGKERLIKYYQCGDLQGMRMVAGEYVRACVNMALADDEGKFKIWVELPLLQMTSFMAAAKQVRPDVIVGTPAFFFIVVLGGFFQKMDNLQEYAEARWLPAGDAHCGCTKMRIGLRQFKYIPTSDFTVSPGLLCDEAPKTDELVHYLFGEKVFALNRPLEDLLYANPMASRSVGILAENIEALRLEISAAMGVELTDEMIKTNLKYWMKIGLEAKEIAVMRATAEAQPLREASWNLVRFLAAFNQGKGSLERMSQIYGVMKKELQEKIAKGEGVVPKGSPRLLICPFSPLGTPDISYELENSGINICCHEDYGNKIVAANELEAVFAVTPGSVMYAMSTLMLPLLYPARRVECMKTGFQEANIDGILLLSYYGCRTLSAPFYMMKEWLIKEIGPNVPIAILDSDLIDPRYHGIEQMRTRLQTFAEVLHLNNEKRET